MAGAGCRTTAGDVKREREAKCDEWVPEHAPEHCRLYLEKKARQKVALERTADDVRSKLAELEKSNPYAACIWRAESRYLDCVDLVLTRNTAGGEEVCRSAFGTSKSACGEMHAKCPEKSQ